MGLELSVKGKRSIGIIHMDFDLIAGSSKGRLELSIQPFGLPSYHFKIREVIP
jgi:hypothetical protein